MYKNIQVQKGTALGLFLLILFVQHKSPKNNHERSCLYYTNAVQEQIIPRLIYFSDLKH